MRRLVAVCAGSVAAAVAASLLIRRMRARRSLTRRVASMLCDYLAPEAASAAPVVRLSDPEHIEAVFEQAGCALPMGAEDAPVSESVIEKAVTRVLEYSVCVNSPYFYNQLYGRADPVSIVGDWVSTAVNANVHTYEVAPVFTLMERHTIARIARAIGARFEREHDGLFVPGSSIANMYAMHLARHRAAPSIRTAGASAGPRLVAFVSTEAHYSFLKSAQLLGLGSENLVKVGVDRATGSMDPMQLRDAVRAAVESGGTPFFVGATAGSTVRGAFDPLRALARVCLECGGMWLHVDGAWGGAALFSPTHRDDLDGCDLADSFCLSAHKMLGAALQCAVFVTRHTRMLAEVRASARAAPPAAPPTPRVALTSSLAGERVASRLPLPA